MAKKETITIGTASAPVINIHFTVGTGGKNEKGDVMLIQALFLYIGCIGDNDPMRYLGFPLSEMPEVTGICDSKTKSAIFKFQQRNARKLLSADGLIHPASYEGRNIKSGVKRMMTITLLHFHANDVSMSDSESSYYIDGLLKMVPYLRPWLM